MSGFKYPASEGLQVYPPPGEHADLEIAHRDEPKYYIQNVPQPPVAGGLRRTICGLRRRIFWGLVIAAIVVVAAVAGGVGGSLASKKPSSSQSASSLPDSAVSTNASPSSVSPRTSSSSTPLTTPLTSTSAPSATSTTKPTTTSAPPVYTSPASGLLPLDCPALDNTFYSTQPSGASSKTTFEILCDTNFVTPSDIAQIFVDTIQQCMDLCAKQNLGLGLCKGVVFQRNITKVESMKLGGNCFLKADTSNMGVDQTHQAEGAGARIVQNAG